jgi:hypothetical protein
MLGSAYRYQVFNNTGVSVTCTAKYKPFKFASDNSITFGTEATPISAVSVGTGAYNNSSTIDNTTDKNIGAKITATFAPGSSATGTVTLYLQRSTDGGTTWPSDGRGILLGSVYFSASATSVASNMEVG